MSLYLVAKLLNNYLNFYLLIIFYLPFLLRLFSLILPPVHDTMCCFVVVVVVAAVVV